MRRKIWRLYTNFLFCFMKPHDLIENVSVSLQSKLICIQWNTITPFNVNNWQIKYILVVANARTKSSHWICVQSTSIPDWIGLAFVDSLPNKKSSSFTWKKNEKIKCQERSPMRQSKCVSLQKHLLLCSCALFSKMFRIISIEVRACAIKFHVINDPLQYFSQPLNRTKIN